MRTIPVDLILHSLLDLLRAGPGTYAEAIALCIDHRRVAEEWQADGDPAQAADWLRRRIDPPYGSRAAAVVGKDTRTIEVAVARRLADVAFALCIEQTAEATAHATTLLRAAQAIVGLESDVTYKARAVASQPLMTFARRGSVWAEKFIAIARAAGAKDPRVEALDDIPGGLDYRVTLSPNDDAKAICSDIWGAAETAMAFHGANEVALKFATRAIVFRYDVA